MNLENEPKQRGMLRCWPDSPCADLWTGNEQGRPLSSKTNRYKRRKRGASPIYDDREDKRDFGPDRTTDWRQKIITRRSFFSLSSC
ncbi:hypothetical protein NPIL_34521 [Nephila pilipes]|uniref:Uncharacterized protein n=1 Tax=Nephila pilipes TaxID=299642 RepID=A0A8X6TES0_NEPPI|nr:hypothetical protein NPIL_34521 [Nephila pilipes]